jgi:hypothetical protein
LCYYTSEVSCPYFYPVEARTGNDGPRTALLPLGALWSGVCRSTPDEVRQPAGNQLQCHLGYARGECQRFPPEDAGADAVRFTIAGDDGASLRLYFVLERDHHPFLHGPVEYSLTASVFTGALPAEIIRRQAEAYVETYLRRKKEAHAR